MKRAKKEKLKLTKKLKTNNQESRKFIDYVQRAKKVYPNEKYIVEFRKKTIEKVFSRFEKGSKNI